MAFFGMFAAYLLAAYAEHTQNVLLYIIGSLSLSLTLGLHAAYLTWLILDVGILSTTITRLAVRSPVKLHFSPVWGIPIAGLCCPGVLLLPLSVIHLLHDRKKVIKQLTERASDRAVPWTTIREVISSKRVIIALVLTWLPTCIMLAFNLLNVLFVVSQSG